MEKRFIFLTAAATICRSTAIILEMVVDGLADYSIRHHGANLFHREPDPEHLLDFGDQPQVVERVPQPYILRACLVVDLVC